MAVTISAAVLQPGLVLSTQAAAICTAPAGVTAVLKRAVFTNLTTGAATITVSVVRASTGTRLALIPAQQIDADGTYLAPELANLVLAPGDSLYAQTTPDAAVLCVASGFTTSAGTVLNAGTTTSGTGSGAQGPKGDTGPAGPAGPPGAGAAAPSVVVVPDTSPVQPDASTGTVFQVVLTQQIGLLPPLNMKAGETYVYLLQQDAVGGHGIAALGANFRFAGPNPVLSSMPNAIDILTGVSDGTRLFAVFTPGFRT